MQERKIAFRNTLCTFNTVTVKCSPGCSESKYTGITQDARVVIVCLSLSPWWPTRLVISRSLTAVGSNPARGRASIVPRVRKVPPCWGSGQWSMTAQTKALVCPALSVWLGICFKVLQSYLMYVLAFKMASDAYVCIYVCVYFDTESDSIKTRFLSNHSNCRSTLWSPRLSTLYWLCSHVSVRMLMSD